MSDDKKLSVLDFSSYITERTVDYTDREWIYEDIDAWLSTANAPPFYHLTGEPGSGKTAISARLTQFSARAVEPPANLKHLSTQFLSAAHFCSVRHPDWTNPFEFAQSIASQLASRYPAYRDALTETQPGEGQGKTVNIHVEQTIQTVSGGQVVGVSVKVSAPTPEDAFNRVVRKPLKALPSADVKKMVILVDALDESLIYSGKVGIIALLTQLASDETGLRFLVTSRPQDASVLEFLPNWPVWPQSLSTNDGATHSLKDVERHIVQEISPGKKYHPLVAKLDANLPAETFTKQLSKKSEGNFLYIYHILPMLAAQSEPITQTSLDALPSGLDAIYQEFLGRLVKPMDEKWKDAYRPVLGTLAVAREPLNENQVAGMVEQAPADARLILDALLQYLDVDTALPLDKRCYAIYHRSFADFLLDGARAGGYWCDEETQHQRILDFCRKQADAWEPQDWKDYPDEWDVDDVYTLKHWVGHLEAVYALAKKSKAKGERAQDLFDRALNETFQSIQIERLGDSGVTQANLRTALDLALARNDAAAVLACAGSYRAAARQFSMVDAVFAAVRDGDFERADQRAGLSGATPPWMAVLYRYLAWEAALVGNEAVYQRALERAQLFPQEVTWRLCDALQAQSEYVRNPAGDAVSAFYANWGLSTAPLDSEMIKQRLSALDAALSNLEAMVERGEAEAVSMPGFIDEFLGQEVSNLGAALLSLAPYDEGRTSIDRALAAAVIDPYPAYRDLALVPVGIAAVFVPDLEWARERIQRVLRTAIEGGGVTFTFDLAWTLLEEARRRGLSVSELEAYVKGLESCYDRWGTALRASSAHAAALFYQGAVAEAYDQLYQTAEMNTGYAGYGSVTLLALANHLCAFGLPDKATQPIWGDDHNISLLDGALGQAERVVDPDFRWARECLVKAYLDWWESDLDDTGTALAAAPHIPDHDTRMAYLEHLSARWVGLSDHPNWEGLKALVSLALLDATALDTVLARIVGVWMQTHTFTDDALRDAIRICAKQLATARPWELGQWSGAAK